MRAIWAIVLCAAAHPAAARDVLLGLPIDCTLGRDCFIQNFVDADAGSGAADFTCGSLTYDGHKGTDFALLSHVEALKGVSVLAAAPGTVKAIRDGLPDKFLGRDAPFPDGQDCGNGLVIDHGGGWQTQYCHLRNGSVSVRPGQKVAKGTALGDVGMSGRTEFPHLHISVRHDNQVVDPFNSDGIIACGEVGDDQLWQDQLDYDAGGMINAGFETQIPKFDQVKFGQSHKPLVFSKQGALVFWAQAFGARKGDVLHMTIDGPDGVFLDKTIPLEKHQARTMRAVGRKLHAENTVPGTYTGLAVLMRDGHEVGRITSRTVLE